MKYLFLASVILLVYTSMVGQINNDSQIIKSSMTSTTDTTFIDPLSTISLYVESVKNINGTSLPVKSGTGFIYQVQDKKYLVTNWHVVTNRNPSDGSPNLIEVKDKLNKTTQVDVSDPEQLRIYFHAKVLGNWLPVDIDLYNSGKRYWLEHPNGRNIDVVAIPINLPKEISSKLEFYTLKKEDYNDDILLYPSINLSIIGFPYGFASFGKFPIWKTGQLASDYGLNFNGLPIFLIDASTRGGMSGSPVIIKSVGSRRTSQGFSVGGTAQKFLGIYSGRLPNDSDIGIVWKIECLEQIIN